jgi:DNA polymerase III subunit alpha
MRFGLLFERFLNPERVSMPDFDIDFCQDRRDEVIDYVQERYGADRWRRSSPSAPCRRARWCATSAACSSCPIGQVDS